MISEPLPHGGMPLSSFQKRQSPEAMPLSQAQGA
jgi:hypothetical protein